MVSKGLNLLLTGEIMKKYFIKQEIMDGEMYYMIYIKWFGIFESFYERWNTFKTATKRINELKSINK